MQLIYMKTYSMCSIFIMGAKCVCAACTLYMAQRCLWCRWLSHSDLLGISCDRYSELCTCTELFLCDFQSCCKLLIFCLQLFWILIWFTPACCQTHQNKVFSGAMYHFCLYVQRVLKFLPHGLPSYMKAKGLKFSVEKIKIQRLRKYWYPTIDDITLVLKFYQFQVMIVYCLASCYMLYSAATWDMVK